MNVKLVKIVSGEEFIAEIIDEKNSGAMLKVKNMMKLMPTKDGLVPVPLNPLIPENTIVNLDNSHVTFMTDVIKELENAYVSMHGGIVTGNKKLII